MNAPLLPLALLRIEEAADAYAGARGITETEVGGKRQLVSYHVLGEPEPGGEGIELPSHLL